MPPPEPNKKIDDLLKAYSRKRREQAEPGFELHPVSRKALLEEVGRTFAEKDSKAPVRWRWSEWWRWLAVGGAMAWVLFLCLYIQMPATHTQEQSSLSSLPPPVLQPAPMAAAKTAELPRTAVASDSSVHTISPPPPAAAAPAVVASPAQPPAGVVSQSASDASSVSYDSQGDRAKGVVTQNGLGVRKKDQAEDSVAVANAPQSAASLDTLKQSAEGAGIAGAVQSQNRRGQQFVQFNNRAQYRENVLSPPLPKVLTAFEVERTGNKVRVTDVDGSVYEGEVTQPVRARRAAAAEDKLTVTDGVTTKSGTKAGDNYSFQVSGLNRNLKQNVVFTGSVGEAGAISGGVAVYGGGAQTANQNSFQNQRSLQNNQTLQNQSSIQNQQSFQNISCEGSVKVGKTTEFQIQATPVP